MFISTAKYKHNISKAKTNTLNQHIQSRILRYSDNILAYTSGVYEIIYDGLKQSIYCIKLYYNEIE